MWAYMRTIELGDVPAMEKTFLVNRLCGLVRTVHVAHEYVSAFVTQLASAKVDLADSAAQRTSTVSDSPASRI
jgi:hypothetical protein